MMTVIWYVALGILAILAVLFMLTRVFREAWEEAKREVGASRGLEYVCPFKGCGCRFKTGRELQKHILTVHQEKVERFRWLR